MTIQISRGDTAATDCTTSCTAPQAPDRRLVGLRTFAISITVLNLLGHTILGFEQSWITPFVALAAAYSTELAIEVARVRAQGGAPRFLEGGFAGFVDFLLPAHISGLAVGMLTYANDWLWPVAFGAAAAIASKTLLTVAVGRGRRHFFNPSNFGITLVLLLFPSVGAAPPYQFTEGLSGIFDWLLPLLILMLGSRLNARATRRLPLIGAWVGGFALQALIRSLVFGTPLLAGLAPMTGLPFVLFSLYMISDPGTTPSAPRCQMVFGASVALAYGLLLTLHIGYALFFALTGICALRGLTLIVRAKVEAEQTAAARSAVPVPVAAG